MRITGKNYYELLKVSRDATAEDIEEAYKKAVETYGRESMAVYSLFSKQDRDELLETIASAYDTLRDPEKRRVYDEQQKDVEEDNEPVQEARVSDPEIGEIRHDAKLVKNLLAMDGKDYMAVEQYRILYTKLEEFKQKKNHGVFAVTSSVKGEGKTVTALNTAYIMAQEFKKRTLLIEFDLKNPSISNEYIQTSSGYGLTDVLRGDVDPEAAIVRLEGTELDLILGMKQLSNPLELFNSPYMRELFETVRKRYDFIILDCPPVTHLADMNVISRVIDGVVMVVRANNTPKEIVNNAVKSLNDINIAGFVLNRADPKLRRYSY